MECSDSLLWRTVAYTEINRKRRSRKLRRRLREIRRRQVDNVLPRFPVCSFQVSATPILDLHQAPPEPRKFKFWRYVLIGVTLGAAIATIKILEEENIIPAWDPPTFPAFNGLLLLPAVYLAIAFHEIGHLLAGKLVGLNTGGISVGAFVLLRSGKKLGVSI